MHNTKQNKNNIKRTHKQKQHQNKQSKHIQSKKTITKTHINHHATHNYNKSIIQYQTTTVTTNKTQNI